jgi:hypothetical protein
MFGNTVLCVLVGGCHFGALRKAAGFCGTSVSIYRTVRDILKDRNCNVHCLQNLKSKIEENISVVIENSVKRGFVMLDVPVTEKWKL